MSETAPGSDGRVTGTYRRDGCGEVFLLDLSEEQRRQIIGSGRVDRGARTPPHVHEMGIYKRYFDLIAAGRKTTEIRVNDSSRQNIAVGSLIRFKCRDDKCRDEEVLTRVTSLARYDSFEEMFDHEDVTSVNPTATRAEQLANIRQIYPPEREALGVVAIGIELVDPPTPAGAGRAPRVEP